MNKDFTFHPKLIVTDLDGTALRDNKEISPATKNAFLRFKQAGIPIAIATARYIAGAAPYAKALSADYQLLTDGTLVFYQNHLFYSNAMDCYTTNTILSILRKKGYTKHIAIPTTQGIFRYPQGIPIPSQEALTETSTIVSPTFCLDSAALSGQPNPTSADQNGNTIGWHFDIEKPFPFPANKLVVAMPEEKCAIAIMKQCDCQYLRYRDEDRYTFFHPSAGKLDAIRQVAKHLCISLDDVLVFGDDRNDMDMIQHCGMGVAMANALPEVLNVANAITLSNEEDGVASFLNHLELANG